MRLSNKGAAFICVFEGYSEKAYKCPAGVWTIGFGTIKYPNGASVKQGDTCTNGQALLWLSFEVNEKCSYLNQILGYYSLAIKQNQYDAIASIIYNCGTGILKEGKSLGDAIKSKDLKKIAESFLVYNKITVKILGVPIKKTSKGLDNRRKAEYKLFVEGAYA